MIWRYPNGKYEILRKIKVNKLSKPSYEVYTYKDQTRLAQERDKNIEMHKCYGIVLILRVPLLHKILIENLT
jgi:hypothetical protein